jgi:D-tyrosyl-tRNA(Tyr) deacylase
MRIVLQRVARASVTVDGSIVGQIDRGLLCLLGFCVEDSDPQRNAEALSWLVNKVLNARLWPADGKQWAGSCKSLGYPVLLVSQFTLHGSLTKPKPSFHRSLGTAAATALWADAVRAFTAAHGAERIQTGVFGAMMQVDLCNDGPVTLCVDTANRDDQLWEGGAKARAPQALDGAAAAELGGGGGGGGGGGAPPAAEE